MKSQTALLITLCIFLGIKAFSQPPAPATPRKPTVSVGFGAGLDYGGFGLRANYTPIKYAGIFASAGYNIVGLGYNLGVAIKTLPNSRVCPYLTAMYGYNAFIAITGITGYDKTYYGPTAGLGLEIWNPKRINYFNIEFLYPFHSQEFHDDLNAIKRNPLIKLNKTPPNFAFSIGYHIGLRESSGPKVSAP